MGRGRLRDTEKRPGRVHSVTLKEMPFGIGPLSLKRKQLRLSVSLR